MSPEPVGPGPQPDEMVRLQQALDAAEGEIERLKSAGPLISQALDRGEMPSWRYAHYYSSDERTTSDLLREALEIIRPESRS